MKTLVLNRTYFKDATIGHLFIAGEDNPVWHTIERPDLDNKRNVSCIPEGKYLVKPYSSNKYPDVWEVQDVPNRSKILFHGANWAHQLEGCIAVGLSSGYMKYGTDILKAVTSSGNAIHEMKKVLQYPNEFTLIVRS